MKSKTIKSVMRRKIQAWVETIKDEELRDIILKNVIVTGGSICNMLMNEPVNDFDVYFRTPESLFAVAAHYIKEFTKNPPPKFKSGAGTIPIYLGDANSRPVNTFAEWKAGDMSRLRVVVKSQGVAGEESEDEYQYFEGVPDASDAGAFVDKAIQAAEEAKKKEDKPSYRPVFITSNAITLSDQIQIVVRFWGEPKEIHDNYDFVHCMNYWQSWDGFVGLNAESLECILNKELRYVGSRYPVCSLFRIRKFLDRGWKINAGQILKAVLQCSKLDLSNPKILEDQLIGVDAAYFNEVIRLCQKRLEETNSDRVDYAYLVELIDKFF